MNPAYLQLLASLASTTATLVAQSKGKDVSGLINITPIVQAAMTAYGNSLSVLGRAHAEGWKDDDVRWAEPFAGVDAVLEALSKRMT